MSEERERTARGIAGIHAKIERANQHIHDLQNAMRAWSRANHYGIRSEYNPQTKICSLIFANCPEPPLAWSIQIGEILHQQRSSLDHLVFQLAAKSGVIPGRSCGFPIFPTLDRYKAKAGRMIKGVSISAEKRIKKLQPFNRRIDPEKDPLWVLQDLNNTDKHRLLVVLSMFLDGKTGGAEGNLTFDPSTEIRHGAFFMIMRQTPIKDGEVFMQVEIEREAKAKIKGKLSVEITLSEVGHTKNQPIIPLLTQLSGYVRGIVDSFAPEFV